MVLPAMLQSVEDALFGWTGSLVITAFLIMAFFLICFMMAGVDFRFAIMLISPSVLAFSDIGWFPSWVAGVFWILAIAFGGYVMWSYIKDK